MAKKLDKQVKSTKAERITELLLRSNGATLAEMTRSTDWQSHSVRGFMSGILKKKLRLEITSKAEDGKPRRYFLVRGAT